MRSHAVSALFCLLAGCEARIAAAPSDDAPTDAATDTSGSSDAAPLGPWTAPDKVSVAATTASEDDATLSSDTLEMVFAIDAGNGNGKDLYYIARKAVGMAWSSPVPLGLNIATQSDETPRLSPDDLTLYFASVRAGNNSLDVYAATRPARGSPNWSNPTRLGAVSTAGVVEKWYMPCGANRYVMIQNHATTSGDLMEGTVGAGPVEITALNSTQNETGAFVTPDCLTIYFASTRSGTALIYTSTRAAVGQPFAAPSLVTDFKLPAGASQEDPWLSPDGRTFALAADLQGAGNKDVYLSTR